MKSKLVFLTWMTALTLSFGLTSAGAQDWTPAASSNTTWQAIAASADGTKLVAAAIEGSIYTSTNSGFTWTLTGAPTNRWSHVASSADGTRLVAVAESPEPLVVHSDPELGAIYISTNSGATWTQASAPTNGWASVASSADGARLVSLSGEVYNQTGPIYVSMDGGAHWTDTGAPSNLWQSVASSADGTKLVAVAGSGPIQPLGIVYVPVAGPIYRSTDSGSTWTPSSAPSNVWRSVTCSADGSKLAAVLYEGRIYTSTNFGASWTPTSAPSNYWTEIASSADGGVLAATAYYGGQIYLSTDSGGSWSSVSPSNSWTCVAASADGNRLAAAGTGTVVYTGLLDHRPRLNIKCSGSQVGVSWIWPSTNLLLEQNDNLENRWTGVSPTPTLVLSNLQYQVTVSPTNSQSFFRLRSP